METTLQELLHALNIIGEDRYVLVEGFGRLTICPPVKLTPTGREYFKKALSATVISDYDKYNCHLQTYVCDKSELKTATAYELLSALDGNCSENMYHRWFGSEAASMI